MPGAMASATRAAMLEPRRRLRQPRRAFPLAHPRALQHRRRRLRPLGGGRARSAPPILEVAADGRVAHAHLRRAARALEPPRQRAARARHRARRPGRDPAAAGRRRCRSRMSRSTSSARSRCRSRRCSASTRSRYRLRDAGARALVTNAAGLAKLAAIAERAAGPRDRRLDRRAGRRAPRASREALERGEPRFRAGRHRAPTIRR